MSAAILEISDWKNSPFFIHLWREVKMKLELNKVTVNKGMIFWESWKPWRNSEIEFCRGNIVCVGMKETEQIPDPSSATNHHVTLQQAVNISGLSLYVSVDWRSRARTFISVATKNSVIQCLNWAQAQMKLSNLKCVFGSHLLWGPDQTCINIFIPESIRRF